MTEIEIYNEEDRKPDVIPPTHYYGDLVRKIFVASGLLVLTTLPFLYKQWPFTFYEWLIMVFALVLFAGVTNPKTVLLVLIDCGISSSGFLFFGIATITAFQTKGLVSLLFWTNEILAILFLFAVYFSTKTLRGMLLHKKHMF